MFKKTLTGVQIINSVTQQDGLQNKQYLGY